MSETPSLEPNQSNLQPGSESEKQPETLLPDAGDAEDAVTAAQAAIDDAAAAVAPARAVVLDEPPALLHNRAPPPHVHVAVESAADVAQAQSAPLRIDHVPNVGHAYPGEAVVLHTRVRVVDAVPGLVLLVDLPGWVRVEDVNAPATAGVYALQVDGSAATRSRRDALRWEVSGPLAAGTVLQFETTVVARALDLLEHSGSSPDEAEHEIISKATAVALGDAVESARVQVAETAVVALRRKGGYLKYLPAVFERDPFMARFLMLFESFWGPIDGQIANLSDYFDPMITTLPMLKWLAERLDLQIDDELPVGVVRKLVAKAVPLYRRRGTRSGLEELLEIYTGGTVQIVERRANNLRLGSSARLGQGVALGVRNQPHTFTLYIKLPPIVTDPDFPAVAERQRARRRERLHTLVELEKPAHVTYTLEVDED